MIVLDASVLVAHFSEQDRHHRAAVELLLGAAGVDLLAHSLTLAEVLVGGARIGRVEEMYADILALGVFPARRDDSEPLRLAALRVSTGLRLPDCCVLDAAMTNGARLATFDQALARAAPRSGVPVLSPSTARP